MRDHEQQHAQNLSIWHDWGEKSGQKERRKRLRRWRAPGGSRTDKGDHVRGECTQGPSQQHVLRHGEDQATRKVSIPWIELTETVSLFDRMNADLEKKLSEEKNKKKSKACSIFWPVRACWLRDDRQIWLKLTQAQEHWPLKRILTTRNYQRWWW